MTGLPVTELALMTMSLWNLVVIVALGVFVLVAVFMSSRRFRRLCFATFYDRVQRCHEEYLDDRRRELLGSLSGRVLEIGPGTGINFLYMPGNIEWIGLEPNPHMHSKLRSRAMEKRITAEIRRNDADEIALPDQSVDHVVSTLVLCSVRQLDSTLAEIHRVLKKGGHFAFLEHVAAPPRSALRHAQRRIRPLWRVIADGCCPDREIADAIENAGFSEVRIDAFQVPREIVPQVVGPHVMGIAIK